MKVIVRAIVAVLIFGVQVSAAPKYDLLLKGGQVIDPRNGVNGARDVAILAGKIAGCGVDRCCRGGEDHRRARAVEAGTLAALPVMVDFGARKPERPLAELVTRKLRPGDIYTHMYSGLRGEQDESGKVNPALWEARKRGVLFDVGHGGTSFAWRIAVPAVKEGWLPDVISTDLHVASMSAGMKDMPNVMSKFLALGLPFDEIVRKTTWNAAGAIRQEDLGHLRVGADADVAVWRIERGSFGFVDGPGTRLNGSQRVAAELTLRNGRVVYDLNGISQTAWAP